MTKIEKHPFFVSFGVVVLLLSLTVPVMCDVMSEQEIERLITHTDMHASPAQYESYMVMHHYKPNRKPVVNRTRIYRKEDKMVVVFLSPAVQKGQSFVRNGDDMWMYMPKSKKIIRIGAKDKSMGGEASNIDIMRVDLAKDYYGTYVGEEVVEGELCHKIELTAKQRLVAYDKIVYWISCNRELPVKREYYALSGKKIKSMYFKNITALGDMQRPSLISIVNENNTDFKTEMVIECMNAKVDLEDHMFYPEYMKRGNLR